MGHIHHALILSSELSYIREVNKWIDFPPLDAGKPNRTGGFFLAITRVSRETEFPSESTIHECYTSNWKMDRSSSLQAAMGKRKEKEENPRSDIKVGPPEGCLWNLITPNAIALLDLWMDVFSTAPLLVSHEHASIFSASPALHATITSSPSGLVEKYQRLGADALCLTKSCLLLLFLLMLVLVIFLAIMIIFNGL